jgi:hypothetical protein
MSSVRTIGLTGGVATRAVQAAAARLQEALAAAAQSSNGRWRDEMIESQGAAAGRLAEVERLAAERVAEAE